MKPVLRFRVEAFFLIEATAADDAIAKTKALLCRSQETAIDRDLPDRDNVEIEKMTVYPVAVWSKPS